MHKLSVLSVSGLVAGLLFSPATWAESGEAPTDGQDDAQAGEIPAELLGEDGQIDVKKLQEALEAKLEWKTGTVELPGGKAKLKLSDRFRYIGPEDAAFVLENLWGNPPGPRTLGMIFPSDVGPIADDSWGVAISYSEDGYVDDDDAEDIDYDDLLKDMQESTADANQMRREQGYPAMTLVGWAEPPHYDKAAKKLYWAQELKVENDEKNTLNYDIRVLGRRGYLVLSAISSMEALQPVKTGMQDVLKFVEFNDGHRYEDFDPELDKVAAYGVGALVAGKLAAKTGLFAALAAILAKSGKLIVLAVAGIGAAIAKFFGRSKN